MSNNITRLFAVLMSLSKKPRSTRRGKKEEEDSDGSEWTMNHLDISASGAASEKQLLKKQHFKVIRFMFEASKEELSQLILIFISKLKMEFK